MMGARRCYLNQSNQGFKVALLTPLVFPDENGARVSGYPGSPFTAASADRGGC